MIATILISAGVVLAAVLLHRMPRNCTVCGRPEADHDPDQEAACWEARQW